MRGLVLDFSNDAKVNNISDQFMFGKSLMVCPVTSYLQREREVYLPSSAGWYDFYTGEFYKGGNSINAKAPLDRIPLYVKAGSILTFGPEIQYALQPTDGSLKIFVYTGEDASFNLYEDEGVNYNYEKGEFTKIELNYNEEGKNLVIGKRAGSYTGMANEREIQIYFFDDKMALPFNLDRKADKIVKYSGEEISILR